MRIRFPAAYLVLLAPILVACESSHNADRNALAEVPEWTIEEQLRVGSLDDPDKGFSQIDGIAVGTDGLLYVLEGQDRQVRVYDHYGRLLRGFGRRGHGPGEIEEPYDFGVIGDTVWVSELGGNRRVTLFTTAGELITTVSGRAKPFTGKTVF